MKDASLQERDTLRYATENYRLSDGTRLLLEAIRRLRPREFLTFDELFAELARFYLARQPTLRAEVERWLSQRTDEGDERESDRGEG